MKTVEPKAGTVTNPPRVPAEAGEQTSTLDAQLGVSPSIANPLPAIASIAVIGLGYVGLPLSIQFARSGFSVLGLDIDLSKVLAVNRAQSYITHISSQSLAELVAVGKFS